MVYEKGKNIPIIDETDICVIGGSTTGVFAAVRAARLGAKVIIVEKQNCFGGTATAGFVCAWHSLMDINFEKQIIGGLSVEVIERLKRRNALVEKNRKGEYRIVDICTYVFNTEELKIELDEIILENRIKPYLHTLFAAPYIKDGKLEGIFVENKSGRGLIKAGMFIDATGDGDLCHRLGIDNTSVEIKQPATTCAKIFGYSKISNASILIHKYKDEYNIPDIGWDTNMPNLPEISILAKSNIFSDCSNANELTMAEIEGRRQIRAMMDILKKYSNEGSNVVLVGLGSHIGIRETRQIRCKYRLTADDILNGKKFNDAIANGSYPIDIHHYDKPGATYKYIDGIQEYEQYGLSIKTERWKAENGTNETYWQIPYRSMVTDVCDNLIVCGRAIDADKEAFGAIRVMINLNQTGEAAGVAAYEALSSATAVNLINTDRLREKLKEGGSIIL